MEKTTWNVIHLGISIFLLMFAYQCHGNVVLSVISHFHKSGAEINERAGFYSSAIIYGCYTIGNFFAPFVVESFSPKWTLTLACAMYTIFIIGFLHLNQIFLYLSSAVVGLGAALLWNAQGVYLTKNSNENTSKRNNGIFFAIYDASLIGNGLFLFVLFQSSNLEKQISEETIPIIYIVLATTSFLALLSSSLLNQTTKEDQAEKQVSLNILKSTIEWFSTKEMLKLAVPFAFTGLHSSFYAALYSTCVVNTLKLGPSTQLLLPFTVICIGLGICVGGFLFLTPLGKRISRDQTIFLGSLSAIFGYTAIFLTFPEEANQKPTEESGFFEPRIWLSLASASLLSFGGTCWNVQISSLLVEQFPKSATQVWAVFKFYQAIASMFFFFSAAHFTLRWLIGFLLIFLLFAGILFSFREISKKETNNEKTKTCVFYFIAIFLGIGQRYQDNRVE